MSTKERLKINYIKFKKNNNIKDKKHIIII
jgi:hypothetical protein